MLALESIVPVVVVDPAPAPEDDALELKKPWPMRRAVAVGIVGVPLAVFVLLPSVSAKSDIYKV